MTKDLFTLIISGRQLRLPIEKCRACLGVVLNPLTAQSFLFSSPMFYSNYKYFNDAVKHPEMFK